jgi:hypothetical protein
MGNGIYKSTDAGKSWTNMGPQQERGVFRTTDGGQHWARVLLAGENVGCSGLSLDPHNPYTLIAGLWQVEMHTWGELSGGSGSGIYVSHEAIPTTSGPI